MRISKHIKNLHDYIVNDKIYQDYKNGIEPSHNDGNADFEWFCIDHCEDIEWALNKLKEKQPSNLEIWKQNQELQLCHITFINDLDTILMLLKEQPTEKNIKNISKLIKATRDELARVYSE